MRNKDQTYIVKIFLNRGDLFFKARSNATQSLEALNQYKEALKSALRLNYEEGIMEAYIGIGKCYEALGRQDKAITTYKLAREYSKKLFAEFISRANNLKEVWNIQVIDPIEFEKTLFLKKLEECKALEKLLVKRQQQILFVQFNNDQKSNEIEQELQKKANEVAILFMKMDQESDLFVEEELKKQNLSYQNVQSILLKNHDNLKQPMIAYQKHLIDKIDSENFHVADLKKMVAALEATTNVMNKLNFFDTNPVTITSYKSYIKETLKSLDTQEENRNKTNIELITQDKDPTAVRVFKAVIAVMSGLAIVGLGTLVVLVNDSKKRKGTLNFFSSEGEIIRHAKELEEENLHIKEPDIM